MLPHDKLREFLFQLYIYLLVFDIAEGVGVYAVVFGARILGGLPYREHYAACTSFSKMSEGLGWYSLGGV